MTLTLKLTPEEEVRLTRAAQTRGVDKETVLRQLLEYLPAPDEDALGDGKPSLEDLETMFEELVEGAENKPVLSPEATTRAGIYAEHD